MYSSQRGAHIKRAFCKIQFTAVRARAEVQNLCADLTEVQFSSLSGQTRGIADVLLDLCR